MADERKHGAEIAAEFFEALFDVLGVIIAALVCAGD